MVAGAGWPLENLRLSRGVKFDLVPDQYGDQTRFFLLETIAVLVLRVE